jgi:hypothetical protein
MERKEIFDLIERERVEQDKVWKDRSQYKRSAAHILVLQGQIKKLEDEWYVSDLNAVLDRFKKIATIAVRALEEIEPRH